MEVDSPTVDINTELDKEPQGRKEGKRAKCALPPAHLSVFSSDPSTLGGSPKSKFTSNRRPVSSGVSQSEIREFVTQSQDNGRSSGIDERLRSKTMTDFNIDSKNSNGNEISLEAIADALSTPKLIKSSIMARAEICPKIKRARLMSTKGIAGKIREQYGYDISNTTFLYAEETLYLLEMARLEVHLGRVPLGAERARALLLHSKSHPFPDSNPTKIKTCSIDEYLVYKHLSELGYRVRRRDSDVKVNVSQSSLTASRERLSPLSLHLDNENVDMEACDGENMDEGCRMELDEEECLMQQDTIAGEVAKTVTPQSLSSSSSGIGKSAIDTTGGFNQTATRGTKRKFGDLSSDHTPGSATSSAKDMSDDECADEEDLEIQHIIGESFMNPAAAAGVVGDASFFNPSTSIYTVTEADSDVEIMEEPEPGPSTSCSNGVYIEEIGYGYDGDIEEDGAASQEPKPSTSSACHSSNFFQPAVVHLADSDSETEDFSIINKVWCKFVPNSTIQIGFPPSSLLPPNIPVKDAIYEFDLRSRESNRSDSDLEYYVDELSLNCSPPSESNNKPKNKGGSFKSWKEWRQGAITEAQDILNESLLGQRSTTGSMTEDALQKLHLWGDKEPKCKKRADEGLRGFNIPYELYHPSVGFTKHKNRKDCPPSYVVAVVRYDEEVPSFAACDALVNGIPVLIAVVSDESSIMFMNPDGSPIPSLF